MKPDPRLKDVLDVLQVAKMLDVSESAVKAFIARDQLPAVQIGKSWAIHRSTLEEFNAARQVRLKRRAANARARRGE